MYAAIARRREARRADFLERIFCGFRISRVEVESPIRVIVRGELPEFHESVKFIYFKYYGEWNAGFPEKD